MNVGEPNVQRLLVAIQMGLPITWKATIKAKKFREDA